MDKAKLEEELKEIEKELNRIQGFPMFYNAPAGKKIPLPVHISKRIGNFLCRKKEIEELI